MLLKKNIPNLLTILRVSMLPLMVMSFYIESYLSSWIAAIFFIFASLTDFFDGYLARTWKVQSQVGKILDPIADKMVVISSIVMIIHKGLISEFGIIPALAIIWREISISGLREFLSVQKINLPDMKMAKFKTVVQMTAIIFLIMSQSFTNVRPSDLFLSEILGGSHTLGYCLNVIGECLLWLAAVLTLISGYRYFRLGFKQL